MKKFDNLLFVLKHRYVIQAILQWVDSKLNTKLERKYLDFTHYMYEKTRNPRHYIKAYYYKFILNYYNIYPVGYTIYMCENLFLFDKHTAIEEMGEETVCEIIDMYIPDSAYYLFTIDYWVECLKKWKPDTCEDRWDTVIWFDKKHKNIKWKDVKNER